jgi:hypothetical protein
MDGEMYLAEAPPISVVIWPPAWSSGTSGVTRVNGLEPASTGRWQAFVLAFALGLAAASFAAWQLSISFRSLDEIYLVEFAIGVFAAISTLAFAAICRTRGSERALGITALVLAVAALSFSGVPRWMDLVDGLQTDLYIDGPARDAQIVLEFLVPALIAEIVIWRIALREWRKSRGADARTSWPWLSIAFGAALIFNPLGLDYLSAATRQSPSDWLAGFSLMVSICAAGLLLILALLEYLVRARLRRSSVQAEA